MKDILIADWRNAWKFLSVQIAVGLVVLGTIQVTVLPMLQIVLPPNAYAVISALLGLAIAVGRVLQQPIFGTDTKVAETPKT
jgi:hypothetical protein